MRPGYYVEGRYFAERFHQAEAFARNRAREFGRPVAVHRADPGALPVAIVTIIPQGGEHVEAIKD